MYFPMTVASDKIAKRAAGAVASTDRLSGEPSKKVSAFDSGGSRGCPAQQWLWLWRHDLADLLSKTTHNDSLAVSIVYVLFYAILAPCRQSSALPVTEGSDDQ